MKGDLFGQERGRLHEAKPFQRTIRGHDARLPAEQCKVNRFPSRRRAHIQDRGARNGTRNERDERGSFVLDDGDSRIENLPQTRMPSAGNRTVSGT